MRDVKNEIRGSVRGIRVVRVLYRVYRERAAAGKVELKSRRYVFTLDATVVVHLQAMEYGYSVMRVDSDVVFLEDPYKIINGPLMSPFRVISQTDLFAANTRPKCDRKVDKATLDGGTKAVLRGSRNDIVLCDDAVPNALLNIGLIYFRKSTLTPHKETALYDFFVKLNGKFQSILEDQNADGNAERLLDQPIFRDVMNQFFVGSFKVATAGDGMTSMYQHNACVSRRRE